MAEAGDAVEQGVDQGGLIPEELVADLLECGSGLLSAAAGVAEVLEQLDEPLEGLPGAQGVVEVGAEANHGAL